VTQLIPDVAELFWNREEAAKTPTVFLKICLAPDFIDRMARRFHAVMEEWLKGPQEAVDELCK
jgi:hypothetical protein